MDANTHNFRAVLLRLADGDSLAETSADRETVRARTREMTGLVINADRVTLTMQGREAAERLRPPRWFVVELPPPGTFVPSDMSGRWAVIRHHGDAPVSVSILRDYAERIAALLTQEDLRAVKTYRTDEG